METSGNFRTQTNSNEQLNWLNLEIITGKTHYLSQNIMYKGN